MAERGKRVLIVDDATLVRRYYRDALERAGFTVDEAFNGVEALEKMAVTPFDLLIVDVNMPQMDGMTFLKAVRRGDTEAASTPALVTSTEAQAHDRDAARLAGGNYYLIKPLAQDLLVEHAALLCGVAP